MIVDCYSILHFYRRMHVICIDLPNFIQIKSPRRSYDVVSIFQDGGHGVANLLLVAGLTAVIWKGQNLSALQILMRYLNRRLSYYYFRFQKTDVCHIEILLRVSILTYSSSSAWQIASEYQISSKSAMMSYRFSRWRPWRRKSTSGCRFSDGTCLTRSKSICIPNSMRYINLRLMCYYFRFRKTDVRHIIILLPVCNLIVYVTLAWCPS